MKQAQQGFTLIELIVVIVILGILAATALPKFIDLSSDADRAAVDGIAGAMTSAASINYGAKSLSSGKGVSLSATAATICANGYSAWGTGATGILQGGLPTNYNLAVNGATSCGTEGFVQCTVTSPRGLSAVATVACVN